MRIRLLSTRSLVRWSYLLVLSGIGTGLSAQPSLVTRYCATCHSDRLKSGGLTLAHADPAHVSENPDLWEKVVRKLRTGAMPPAGAPKPEAAQLRQFVASLESDLDRAAPDPGKSLLRRLNRAEYAAAIRDLLALDIDVSQLLPADDSANGFDNMADALRVSPGLLEAYLTASRKISHQAIGDPAVPPAFTTYTVRADFGQDRHIEGLPLGTRGGWSGAHYFPLDGEYVIRTKLAVNTSAKVRGLDFENTFIVTLDGKRVHTAVVGGAKDEEAAAISPPESEKDILARLRVRIPVSAGQHQVGVTFLRKTGAVEDGVLQPFARSNFDTQEQRGIPFVESVSIGGPYQAKGPGDTPSRRRIFVCRPQSASEETGCAKKILAALMRRAYRRPVTEKDLEKTLSLYQRGRNQAAAGDHFEAGIETALRFVLASPEFLFRLETDPAGAAPGSVRQISDLELASRLSFFLWSSVPDGTLLEIAAQGKLRNPGVLERQVRRMLNDEKSRALVTNFAGQWLYLRNLPGLTRDLETFPNFDDNLRQGFRHETELFVESIVREDRSALDFLRADYTFVNERLAQHYGIPGVRGSSFRRVTLPGDQRRGLLGQGSILSVTSYATRTSPVLRGKWLLENVFGTPVPPPPPNVPSLAENHAGVKPRSVRERMEEHRRNPQCAVCHNIMDPLGFALENFDATGAWRDRSEAHEPIDASGTLVDGTAVNGPVTLRQAILSHPDAFIFTLTEKLMTYALGRSVGYQDMPAIRKIVRDTAQDDYRFSKLILGIVESVPFEKKRVGQPPVLKADGAEPAGRSRKP